MAVDLLKANDARTNADYLIDQRGYRLENNADWKERLRLLDDFYRGDFASRFSGDFNTMQDGLTVMNLVQVGLDDISRLVSESLPSVSCPPYGDAEKDAKAANVREAILNTYWEINDGENLVPKLAMDLAGAGAAFATVAWQDEEYPCFHRIDPRFCYPDIHNGKLQDLLVVRTMRLRQAARVFPQLGLGNVPAHTADACEVLEYYSKDECAQAVALTKGGSPIGSSGVDIVKRWKPGLGRVPVAFAQLDTYDGHIRGMFDQVADSMMIKNRIVTQIVDYTDQMVYAPLVSKGVLNHDDPPGPNTHYRLDPNVQDSQFGRVEPAGSSPQVWALLDYLDREQRGGSGYPVQRQGDVQQSIASAAFVNSTMGQLTTSVRNLQRLIANMREDINHIALSADEKYLDFVKPLVHSIDRKKTYSPGKDIEGKYMNRVIYGAGAGFDRMNADVRILQHQGAGLISRRTARENIDYIIDPEAEAEKLELEATEGAMLQKILTESPVDMVMRIYAEMQKGKTLAEAIEIIMEAESTQTGSPAVQPQPGGAPGLSNGPPDAAASANGLSKGAIPGGPAPTQQDQGYQLPQASDVVVKPPR